MTTANPLLATGTSASGASTSTTSTAATSEASDRFLKLLVTQMQNQDPLNPLDNAEVTSQMAQISTVTGMETLNANVSTLNSRVVQLQAMQAASLVGREVAYEGNTLRQADGMGDGGFELSANADLVTIEIRNAADQVIGTVEQHGVEAGRHSFAYDVPTVNEGQPLHFTVAATNAGTAVGAMALAQDRVTAASSFGDTLALELANGQRISNDAVWAYL